MKYTIPATYPDGTTIPARDRVILMDAGLQSLGEWTDWRRADITARTGVPVHGIKLAVRALTKHGLIEYRPGDAMSTSRVRSDLIQA